MFSRNHRSRVTVARGSALEMEFKRGRFRLSVLSDLPEDTELQRKLDHEIRMREGACKLLAACSQREQALEATKSLLVCNSRILSYMGELQRRKEAQVLGKTGRRPSDSVQPPERSPCRGRVCISDLRIPLMWKDTEYFKNKGDLHRWAVFLLLQLGEQIQDTEMVLVDRTLTDISFQNNAIFAEAGPDFELRLELYGACVEEEGALAGAPKRLATKLSSSLGRSSGKRVRASLDSAGGSGNSPILLPTPAVGGPRYHLLAHTTLTLAAVQDGFRTHDLTLTSHEENPAWLPLYGSMCCRLVAQPLCMTQPTASGTLRVQQAGELQSGTLVHGVLKGTNLFCYWRSEDADSGQEPLFTILINKETRVRAGELEQAPEWPFTLSISNRYGDDEVTNTLQVQSRDALQSWMEALWQLFLDMSQWKHCCDEVMKIETPAPRKPPQALAKQGSLYHEMAIEPLEDIAAVTDILAQREGTRLEPPPPWLAMFTDQPALRSSCSPASVPTWTQPLPWGRPRTFSLDAVPADHSLGPSRSVAPLPPQRSPQSRGFYSKSQLSTWLQSPV
ncbi:rhotekin isoform 2 [Rattus norvegicus]|uniref:Rhotekin n=1 Tax=Rattus norvegicus TaxID=10116 RepID=A0A8I6AIK7_RAT|nr:rhotekin isoform 2 [Rattus norvegicus]|eukprot:XP_008761257.1 PREDICTED: rhotekin isoform X2 [Rattus norvegicus]